MKVIISLLTLIFLGSCDSSNSLSKKFHEAFDTEESKEKDFICKRCAEEFSSISDARGSTCLDTPVIERRQPDQYRSRAEVDNMIGPRYGNKGSRWEKPFIGRSGPFMVMNIDRIDPRHELPTAISRDTGRDLYAKDKHYLKQKLNSYYVIKGKSWNEYPNGHGHDLIKQ